MTAGRSGSLRPMKATNSTTISWRMTDDKPLFDPLPLQTPPKFPELARLNHRETELTDPGTKYPWTVYADHVVQVMAASFRKASPSTISRVRLST